MKVTLKGNEFTSQDLFNMFRANTKNTRNQEMIKSLKKEACNNVVIRNDNQLLREILKDLGIEVV